MSMIDPTYSNSKEGSFMITGRIQVTYMEIQSNFPSKIGRICHVVARTVGGPHKLR
jgi:hypothetical protein